MSRARRAGLALLGSIPFLVSACTWERSSLDPAGPAARRLSDLGWPILLGFLVVSAVMWGLLVWVALRRTGTLQEHEPVDSPGDPRWIVVGGFVIPGVAFAAVFVATLRTMSAFPMEHAHGGAGEAAPADIRITGHQWWWEVQYREGALSERVTTANEIHVPAGTPVEIELASDDVIHSFWAPRLHGKVDLVPGFLNRIRIQADRPGHYAGECAEYCGQQHAHMRFLVVAEEPARFEAWLAHERAPAGTPDGEPAQRGQRLFLAAACPMCHTVRGTSARGTVGPELTHLANRWTIAAGSFPRDLAYLHAWVTDAPSLKPGTRMPEISQFTGPELGDLVAYLQSLN
jgi:cytochrome c oxidase subunit II